MRRILSSILAILVLVISCIPCSDVEAAPVSQKQESTIKAAPEKDCVGHTADICSPFCTCSCCAGFAMPVQQSIMLKPCLLFSERALAAHLPEATIEIALPIWQPPQLV